MTDICHVCRSCDLYLHSRFSDLLRVTSDCKPWSKGGTLMTCLACGTTQQVCDPSWEREAERIYQDYSIYAQGDGDEQKVFDRQTGRVVPRSQRMVEWLCSAVESADYGRCLDIGCGNGRFLEAFGKRFRRWKLEGSEFDARCRDIVTALPQVERFHTVPIEEIDQEYDMISLIHVLEHIPNPVEFLTNVASRMLPGGILFVQVPSYTENPFELLIADHASHFTVESLEGVLTRSGLKPISVCEGYVPKEISAIAVASDGVAGNDQGRCRAEDVDLSLLWLENCLAAAAEAQEESSSFGIFGSSIAATWITRSLPRAPDFFVDEDPSRAGKAHLGIQILDPFDIPHGTSVYVPLPSKMSLSICTRLSRSGVSYYPSPQLETRVST